MDRSIPESEILIVIIIGIVVMLLLALAFVLFFYFSQKKFQAERLERQRREVEHQKQLLFGSIESQEKERERIARELHDEIGSKLNVINLGVHQLRKITISEPRAREAVADLFDVLGKTIDATRRISHDLLPPTLESFGLAAALEELCESYQKASDVDLIFEVCQNNQAINDTLTELSIFRVVQELLSNSYKYGDANQIEIKLWMEPTNSRLTYRENGKGFDLTDASNLLGLGMQNIESRMQMIGAKYQLKSAPGKGIFFEMLKPLL